VKVVLIGDLFTYALLYKLSAGPGLSAPVQDQGTVGPDIQREQAANASPTGRTRSVACTRSSSNGSMVWRHAWWSSARLGVDRASSLRASGTIGTWLGCPSRHGQSEPMAEEQLRAVHQVHIKCATPMIDDAKVMQSVPHQRLVLVVDDDEWIRSIITEMLVAEGYAVRQASNGATALELAERLQPSIILLDLALPGRSGLEVLQELKDRRPTCDIPVLVVSAYAMLLLGKDARRADGVIQKPFDLAELLTKVEHVARRSRVAVQ
jgi:CheY-like chemotaxis protein